MSRIVDIEPLLKKYDGMNEGTEFSPIHFINDLMALEQLLFTEQPCEDCISRQKVIEYICEDKECYQEECKGRTLKRCPDLQWVFDLPSVTPTSEDIKEAYDKGYEYGVKEWFEKHTKKHECKSCIHSNEQDGSNCYECVKGIADRYESQPCIEDYPTCTECEHYDSDKHYCPRFCQVIKDALAEAQTCENINEDYADCDQFKCSECQIELQDWHRVERDDDGEVSYHEYTFRYCPHCGRRIKYDE